MLVLQNERGLVFWPCHQVAALTPEYRDRLRVVHADGSVAHCPGPLPRGPWTRLGGSLVNGALLRRTPERFLDPAGFPHPLERVPEVPGPAPEPRLPGFPVSAGQVLYLRGARDQAWWHTDQGRLDAGTSAQAAAALHPHLVAAGRGTYVNRRRLRAIVPEHKRFRLELDTGEALYVSWGARGPLARGLGLPQLYSLRAEHEPLYRESLRDWPFELARASGEQLEQSFGDDLRRLIANQIWQTFRYRQQGQAPDYGTDHRGFWYVPLVATLNRGGFLPRLEWDPPATGWLDPDQVTRGTDGIYLLYQNILGQLIGDERLLTFRELGFQDPRPDLRELGSQRPELVVVGEKTSLQPYLERLGQTFGVSTLVLGGLPSLVSTEYFVEALRPLLAAPVEVVAYVDFDPGGWIAADGFCKQMERYGLPPRKLSFLVLPECFTSEEIELYSFKIPTPTPQIEGKVRAWLARSGGITGEARGLHADHLRPVDRVLEAFRARLRPSKLDR